jgi:predicted Zn-dependent peptidase
MKSELVRLSNGLPLVYRSIPTLETVSIAFATSYGSVYETLETNGGAHFLEHMPYLGTTTKTGTQVKDMFTRACGPIAVTWNAHTGKETTRYMGRAYKSLFSELAEILSDIVINPSLDGEAFETERGTIMVENLEKKDSSEAIAGWTLEEMLFAGHPASLRVIGSDDAIRRRITRDMAAEIHRDYYTPDNSVVAFYGAADAEEIISTAERYFSGLSGKFGGRRIAPVSNDKIDRTVVVERPGLHGAVVGVAIKIPPHSPNLESDYAGIDVLSGLLRRDLFIELRDKRGMAYAMGVDANVYRTHGKFYVLVNTQPENAETVKTIVLEQMQELSDGEFAPELVEDKKGELQREAKVFFAENTFGSAQTLATAYLTTDTTSYIDTLDEAYGNLSLDEVRRIASQYLAPKSSVKVVVKPKI